MVEDLINPWERGCSQLAVTGNSDDSSLPAFVLKIMQYTEYVYENLQIILQDFLGSCRESYRIPKCIRCVQDNLLSWLQMLANLTSRKVFLICGRSDLAKRPRSLCFWFASMTSLAGFTFSRSLDPGKACNNL